MSIADGCRKESRGNGVNRYESLTLWRGVACLLIICYHSTFYATAFDDLHSTFLRIATAVVSRAWIGVPVFFVISGYCIAATIDSLERCRNGIGTYFIRRLRRIYPPFWIFLAIALFSVGLVERIISPGLFADEIHPIVEPSSLTTDQLLGNVTLTESWRFNACGSTRQYAFGHIWSLCYEEQFYLVAGLILLLVPKRLHTAAIAAVSISCVMPLLFPQYTVGFFFDGRWLLFAMGWIIYRGNVYGADLHRYAINLLLLAAAAAVVVVAGPALLDRHMNLSQELFAGLGFGLIISLLYRWDRQLTTFRAATPLYACGVMCYSIYLVHWPLVKALSHILFLLGVGTGYSAFLITLPACVAGSIGIGWLFHVTVERRFMKSRPSLPALKRAAETITNNPSASLEPALAGPLAICDAGTTR
jgi:peptidoglycan/LPS O-acetylase OafA/YrhL